MNDFEIGRFLVADTRDRLFMVADANAASAIRAYMGEEDFNKYEQAARHARRAVQTEHLAVGPPCTLIFVPGVMGSMLKSGATDSIWWIEPRTLCRLNLLQLAPDGFSDAEAAHSIEPCATDPVYEPLRFKILERQEFGAHSFPYDWRKPLAASAARLRDTIQMTYESNGHRPVHLVAHSMGGLMVRACLIRYAAELKHIVGRIVFIGTPHFGAPAIAAYLKNHFWGADWMFVLGAFLNRQTFRSLWGVLGMLPAPLGLYPGTEPNEAGNWLSDEDLLKYTHPCINFDLYKARAWGLGLSDEDTFRLQVVLDGAARFHREMQTGYGDLASEYQGKSAVIAGVGYNTLFRMAYTTRAFGTWETMEKQTQRKTGDPHYEGDGRVPLASALLPGVAQTRYVRGKHGELPNLPQVYEDVFLWLKSQSMKLPRSPRQALQEHLGGGTGGATDDPGYLDFDNPDPHDIEETCLRAEAGEYSAFPKMRLL
jgi:pimeloyl-ACP methyl ester carboxylesterase